MAEPVAISSLFVDVCHTTIRYPALDRSRTCRTRWSYQPLWTFPQQPQTFFERRSSCTIRASGSPKHPARSHSRESPRRQPVHHHLTQIVRGSLCSCTTLAGKSAVCSLLSRLSRGRAIHSRMTFLRVSIFSFGLSSAAAGFRSLPLGSCSQKPAPCGRCFLGSHRSFAPKLSRVAPLFARSIQPRVSEPWAT